MRLSSSDYSLSMKISPRARESSSKSEGSLRSLLVHRLRSARKAVVRLPLKKDVATAYQAHYKVFCEPCRAWFTLPNWGEEIECRRCGQLYALELAVFTAVNPQNS